MRALLIDADAAEARALARALLDAGIHCERAEEGDDAVQIAALYDFDAILLDPSMHDADGAQLLRRLRRAGIAAPIVALPKAATLDGLLHAFAMGADDCIERSRDSREIVARIRAVVRRSRGHADSRIVIHSLTVDTSSRTVEADGQPIHVTEKEYRLLELLTLRRGQFVPRETIADYLYGGLRGPASKVIDVFVSNLRKKLAAACRGEQFIESERGRGYVMRGTAVEAHAGVRTMPANLA